MSAGQRILPAAPRSVTLANEYAPGFLSGITSTIIKDPALILKREILEPLRGAQLTLGALASSNDMDVDIPLDVSEGDKATADMAFITFMLSRYHKEYRRAGTAAKFSVEVGNSSPITFYCMKNYTYSGTDDFTTDNDMILASILGLNTVVSSLRRNGMAGMHPLSRTAITEDGIQMLDEYMKEDEKFSIIYGNELKKKGVVPVKLYNTACARKSHQFTGTTKYYMPELAAAQLIMGVMTSKGQSPGLIDITNRNLAKIAKANGSLDKDIVLELMDFCTPASSAYNAEELFGAYKNKTRMGSTPKIPKTVEALTAYKIPDVNEQRTGGHLRSKRATDKLSEIENESFQSMKRELDELKKAARSTAKNAGQSTSSDMSGIDAQFKNL
ncbi:nucleocapsid protein [Wuhan Insect virus 2]|uniref:Nucleocapsid protein n=1 Tax=Wuhan Insect virus 2 TaxID=1608107 RepID=A0A0B5KFK9_9VIRU|nr:nucleocapsid protein [Wuhan Insect virus 2]AJG39324.2 nucleocapsid protein [Wuhan Insect virus 2]